MNKQLFLITRVMPVVMLWLISSTPVLAAGLADPGGSVGNPLWVLLRNIAMFINNTLIPVLLAIAFLVFVYGVFRYFIAGGANDESKANGRSLAVYAVAGFVLIIIFWGVVNLLANSTGLQSQSLQNLPEPVPVGS